MTKKFWKTLSSLLSNRYRCSTCLDTGFVDKVDLEWSDLSYKSPCPNCGSIEQYELDLNGDQSKKSSPKERT